MKKLLALALLFSGIQLTAMVIKPGKLTFSVAQKGENLTDYKTLLLKVYLEYADPNAKEALTESLSRNFDVLASWIGQQGKLFLKVHDGQMPVGFLTLEALDESNTKVAFHQSPLLPQHLDKAQQYFECAKEKFPEAKSVYIAASDKVAKMHMLIKHLGFTQDASYVPNKELIKDPKGFIGYRKNI